MRPYSPWTNKEHASLIALLGLGKSHREVARALRRSENAVTSKVSELKLRPKKIEVVIPTYSVSIDKSEVPDYYELGLAFCRHGRRELRDAMAEHP